MKVTIHRGANQIGGNIVEISTENTKVLLDVGLTLDEEENKSLPNIKGLFDYAGYDGIFISHYHSDHLGLAYKTHKDIPLYMGEKSAEIVKASDSYKRTNSVSPKGFLKHGKGIVVGDITVTPYLCDHSAFDSYMLLCQGDGESVLYTGDFRGNGRKPYDWLLSQLPNKVDKLICEGTTLSRENSYISLSESNLEEKASELFKKESGPVFVLQSSANIDRIVTMYRSAKKSNRVFLEELYMADITSAAGDTIPNPSFKDVYAFATSPRHYEGLKKYKNRIGKMGISKTKFVMCVRTSMLGYIKDLSKKMSFDGGVLVYSMWNGYRENDEMKSFLSECEAMGLKMVTLHTSGHADYGDIKKLVQTVNPNEIIPIHTDAPEKMKFGVGA